MRNDCKEEEKVDPRSLGRPPAVAVLQRSGAGAHGDGLGYATRSPSELS